MYVLFVGGSATHKVTTSKINSTESPPEKTYKEEYPSPIPPIITQPAHNQLAQWSQRLNQSNLIWYWIDSLIPGIKNWGIGLP
jgi:hypothetical protein